MTTFIYVTDDNLVSTLINADQIETITVTCAAGRKPDGFEGNLPPSRMRCHEVSVLMVGGNLIKRALVPVEHWDRLAPAS